MDDERVYLEHLNGTDLYFEVLGPPIGGEMDEGGANERGSLAQTPLVYLHGGPGYNSASFRALLGERLNEQFPARAVVYLDGRGSGRSGPLSDTEQAAEDGADTLDLDTLVADLEAVRDFLGAERIVPLGHGFGALIALEYARRYPLRTDRVVVVNPWIHYPELALMLLQEASALRNTPLADPADEIRASTPQGQYPPVGSARVEAAFALLNARDLLNAMQFKDAPSRMRLEFTDAESQLAGGGEVQEALVNQGLWEFEYPPFLAEVRRPLYVIAGVHDRSSYPQQAQWLEDLGGADVTVLDAGHYPWLDDEDAFVEALEDILRR